MTHCKSRFVGYVCGQFGDENSPLRAVSRVFMTVTLVIVVADGDSVKGGGVVVGFVVGNEVVGAFVVGGFVVGGFVVGGFVVGGFVVGCVVADGFAEVWTVVGGSVEICNDNPA